MKSSETLHSVVIAPVDLKLLTTQSMYTFISHAEQKGMSTLRGAATDGEFRATLELRLQGDPGRAFEGVASFSCGDVRALVATDDGTGRLAGDRLYFVLDTDAAGRPHHADVFATAARPGVSNKAAWRRQRPMLMAIVEAGYARADAFRGGRLMGAS